MARNIEIKARLADRARVEAVAAALADGPGTLIRQDDTFFGCAKGRLKLREFAAGHGELIFYQRADASGPKACGTTSRLRTRRPICVGCWSRPWARPAGCARSAPYM